jgi:hypothetical protein
MINNSLYNKEYVWSAYGFLIFRRETFLKSIISNKAKVCFPLSTCLEQVIELKV